MRFSSIHSLSHTLVITLVSLLAIFAGRDAVAQADANDEYLTGYLLFQEGESLERNRDYDSAFEKYQRGSEIFDAVVTKFPNWEPRMVSYRRKKMAECLARVYEQLPTNSRFRNRQGNSATEQLPSYPKRAPNYPGRDSTTQAAEASEHIRKLAMENQTLLQKLEQQAEEKDRAYQQLDTSQRASASLSQQLEVLKASLLKKGQEPGSNADVKRLERELHIANDTIVASDARFNNIKKLHDDALSEIKTLKGERDKLTREYADLAAILKLNEGGDFKQLVDENESLKKQLADAQKEIQSLTGDNVAKDEEIASLKGRLKSVEGQLAKMATENEDYRNRIQGLTVKLRDTQKELAETVNKSREGINAEMQKENKVLQQIIVRQLKQQARRRQAKQLVLNELSGLKVESDTLLANIDRLSGASFAMSDEELEIIKGPAFSEAVDENGGISVSIFTPAGEGKMPELPNATSNEGEKNGYGLNRDMTAFAKSASLDFFRGKYVDAEDTYQRILDVVPTNVFTLRNLGIVKTRLSKTDEADDLFKKALAYEPEDDYSHMLYGSFNYKLKKFDKAETAMKKVVELNPKNAKAHFYLGAMSLAAEDNASALKHFEDVVAADSGFADAHYNLAWLMLDKDLAKARHHYRLYLVNGGKEDKAMSQKLGN